MFGKTSIYNIFLYIYETCRVFHFYIAYDDDGGKTAYNNNNNNSLIFFSLDRPTYMIYYNILPIYW
jgi:hypothetical protein